jgi:hypothetical protein
MGDSYILKRFMYKNEKGNLFSPLFVLRFILLLLPWS